jgi:hypothetical protein
LAVGSAEFSNEANFAFLKFARDVLGVKDFAYQAKEVENPSHDDFLISADKNPNRAGVEAMGLKPIAEDRLVPGLFRLGRSPFAKIQKIAFEKNRKVVLFATHDTRPRVRRLRLSRARLGGGRGHHTNRQKRVQKVNRPSPPRRIQAVWEWSPPSPRRGAIPRSITLIGSTSCRLSRKRGGFKGLNDEKL